MQSDREQQNSQIELVEAPPPDAVTHEETQKWHLPEDNDLLGYIHEVQEKIATLPNMKEQVTELAR